MSTHYPKYVYVSMEKLENVIGEWEVGITLYMAKQHKFYISVLILHCMNSKTKIYVAH